MTSSKKQQASKQTDTSPPEGNNVPNVTYFRLRVNLKSSAKLTLKTVHSETQEKNN